MNRYTTRFVRIHHRPLPVRFGFDIQFVQGTEMCYRDLADKLNNAKKLHGSEIEGEMLMHVMEGK